MSKVSVILPVYNDEKNIERSIRSVLNQSYKDYELIIINDGSTDGTDIICKNILSGNEDKVKYIYKSNGGVSKARNIALKQATGKYIMFIDSDDEYYPDTVKEMVTFLENNQYELVTCGVKRISENGKNVKLRLVDNIEKNEGQNYQEYIEKLQEKQLFNGICNKIYLKSIIDKYGITFNENSSYAEDLEFNLKYIDKVDKAGILNLPLFKYVNNNTGLSLNYKENKLELNLYALRLQENLYLKNNFNMQYLNNLYVKKCMAVLKDFQLCKDKPEKSKAINDFISNIEVQNKLKELKKSVSSVNRISIVIMRSKNKVVLNLFSKILFIVDKINKKVKLGY